MKFKTTDSLFSNIRRDLYSFDNAGLLDEGEFHRHVKYMINLLGIKWFREAEEMIEICNYRADLPDDFKQLDAAWRCTVCSDSSAQPDGIVLKKRVFDYYPETQIPDPHKYECPDKNCIEFWEQHKSCIFNRQEEILIQRNNIITKYNNPILLKIGNIDTKRCCTDKCMNVYSKSSDQITINNTRIYTNFQDGHVYLQYHALPIDDETGLPLIPDNALIERALEDYIKYEVIKVLAINGDANIAQMIPLFREERERSLGQAITETKRPSFRSMVNKIRLNRKSLDIYQL